MFDKIQYENGESLKVQHKYYEPSLISIVQCLPQKGISYIHECIPDELVWTDFQLCNLKCQFRMSEWYN